MCCFFFFNPVPSFHLSGLWHLKRRQIQISTVGRHAGSYFGTVRDRQLKRWNEAAPSPRGSDGAPPEHQATPLSSGKDVLLFFFYFLSLSEYGATQNLWPCDLWWRQTSLAVAALPDRCCQFFGFFFYVVWVSWKQIENIWYIWIWIYEYIWNVLQATT